VKRRAHHFLALAGLIFFGAALIGDAIVGSWWGLLDGALFIGCYWVVTKT
jgi:hypothetical protein